MNDNCKHSIGKHWIVIHHLSVIMFGEGVGN